MDFEHASIALLGAMVLVLAGMVGWLYWQQSRIIQNMNNVVMIVGELASSQAPPAPAPAVEEEDAPAEDAPAEDAPASATDEEEDDRASVDKPEPVLVEGPPPEDTDGLESKTKKELQEILTKRGIPFGKGDNKSALVSLLKATA